MISRTAGCRDTSETAASTSPVSSSGPGGRPFTRRDDG